MWRQQARPYCIAIATEGGEQSAGQLVCGGETVHQCRHNLESKTLALDPNVTRGAALDIDCSTTRDETGCNSLL